VDSIEARFDAFAMSALDAIIATSFGLSLRFIFLPSDMRHVAKIRRDVFVQKADEEGLLWKGFNAINNNGGRHPPSAVQAHKTKP
jgi:hypothetical protein